MRLKSLLGLLLVAALVFGGYLWAKPQFERELKKGEGRLPPKVVIEMPNPGG